MLSEEEYQEFLKMLNKSGMESDLEQVLNQYWKKGMHNGGMGKSEPRDPFKERREDAQWNWGIAASLLLLFGLFFYQTGMPDILKNRDMVYQTGFGERIEISLDDGSHITLNANSELKWKGDWENKRSRHAYLIGEAFFEVEKQNSIPFTVHTGDVAVEVLGTSFNVESRESQTEVYLEEGKINLKVLENSNSKRSETATGKEIIMKPGDQVLYNAKERKVEKNEGQTLITAASWKKNVLNFKNMKFSEVLDLLRDIYGQSFECTDSKLLGTPMYLGVPYSDWDAVRQALELSLNIEFQKTANRRYIVKSSKM